MILSHKGPEGYCNNGRRLATLPEGRWCLWLHTLI
nr:MAG TPA: hypothetical protein [Caudoviricetes sp.]